MGLAVITVAAGGLPVKDLGGPGGIAVTEVASYGLAVTKVAGAGPGMGVTFVSATGGPAVTYATLDPATVTAVTLSGGNLVATNTGITTNPDQGARVASAAGKTAGKLYYEMTFTDIFAGGNFGTGIGTTASTYTNMGNSATTGNMIYVSGNIWANGSNSGSSLGARADGNVIGIAVDLDNRKIWFRVAPADNWNNSGTANPATNVGGITIPAGTMVPFCTFGGGGGGAGNDLTANFGASAFVGAVPSGFTAGWPV